MDLTQTTENLLQNLDELIESALMHQQPHGLILDRARSKIKDQHDRIAEMWDALEHLRNERNEMKTDRDIARLNALESDRIHDRMVGELEAIYKERDEARELVKTYKEYAQLLGDEINDTAALAHVHGWRSHRFDQGKILREKIKQLEEKK